MTPGKYYICLNIFGADGSLRKQRVKGWFIIRNDRVAQSHGMAEKMVPVGPLNLSVKLRIEHGLNNGYYEVVPESEMPPEGLTKTDLPIVNDVVTPKSAKHLFDPDKTVSHWIEPAEQFEGHPLRDFKIDSSQHMASGWENHNPDLIHGVQPYKPFHVFSGNITNGTRVAGRTQNDPHVVVKPALDPTELKVSFLPDGQGNSPNHRHFLNPEFGTAHREGAYQKAASFFGMSHFVPRTAVYEDPSGVVHSAHQYMPGTTTWADKKYELDGEGRSRLGVQASSEFLNQNVGRGSLQKLAIMNLVLGNHDRHGGNVLFGPNKNMHLIDHGLSFDYGNAGRNPMPTYARHLMDKPIEGATHQWLAKLDPKKLHTQLVASGVPPDLADKAAYRLAEVKLWSEKWSKIPPDDQGGHLKHALELALMHKFGITAAQRKAMRQKIDPLYNGKK